jgi:hypothetical protein
MPDKEIWIMNNEQRIVLWGCAAAIVVMALFPPVEHKDWLSSPTGAAAGKAGELVYQHTVNYEFLLSKGNGTVVLGDLICQWVIISGIAAVLFFGLKDKKPKGG